LKAQKILAEQEGIFCEPASAVCVAGLMQELDSETISEGSTVVCTLTGHGLKDPDCAIEQSEKAINVSGDLNAVRKIIMEDID
jgi:threonine synthase